MRPNLFEIVATAWQDYDSSRSMQRIEDISALVSTNHVFRVRLENNDFVIAKVSYFGRYENFVEDHSLINVLANNLPAPFDNFLSRSLLKKGDTVYISSRSGHARRLGRFLQSHQRGSNAA